MSLHRILLALAKPCITHPSLVHRITSHHINSTFPALIFLPPSISSPPKKTTQTSKATISTFLQVCQDLRCWDEQKNTPKNTKKRTDLREVVSRFGSSDYSSCYCCCCCCCTCWWCHHHSPTFGLKSVETFGSRIDRYLTWIIEVKLRSLRWVCLRESCCWNWVEGLTYWVLSCPTRSLPACLPPSCLPASRWRWACFQVININIKQQLKVVHQIVKLLTTHLNPS